MAVLYYVTYGVALHYVTFTYFGVFILSFFTYFFFDVN